MAGGIVLVAMGVVLGAYLGLFFGLVWALIGVTVLGALWRAHPDAAVSTGPRVVPQGPVPPPAGEDLAALREPVTACPDCGFVGLRMPGIRDGAWPGGGELVKMVCPRCGYQGMPVEFATREEYARFLRELAAAG